MYWQAGPQAAEEGAPGREGAAAAGAGCVAAGGAARARPPGPGAAPGAASGAAARLAAPGSPARPWAATRPVHPMATYYKQQRLLPIAQWFGQPIAATQTSSDDA